MLSYDLFKKYCFFNYFCRFLGRSQRWPLMEKHLGEPAFGIASCHVCRAVLLVLVGGRH